MGIATSVDLTEMYGQVLGDCRDKNEFLWKHRGRFVHYVQSGVDEGLLDKRFSRKHFRLEKLSYALNPSRDDLLSDVVITTLRERYLLRDESGQLMELPQYYLMRLAMEMVLSSPNPTRAAIETYDRLSLLLTGGSNKVGLFNTQSLLFDRTLPVSLVGKRTEVPEHYYKHGWVVLDRLAADEFEAVDLQQDFISSLDDTRLRLHGHFGSRVQLAKADQIPVCDDIVASSFQVLHFDMGHPFVETDARQLFVSHVGIYLPKNTQHKISGRTRIVEINGLIRDSRITSMALERMVHDYVIKHGDGWESHNTHRLACFMRILDALGENYELADQIDKTVGQWFDNDSKVGELVAYRREKSFYLKHGIDLGEVEHRISLSPGQILILDNTRVVHGRIGRRRAREVFNYMWGIEKISNEDIKELRRFISKEIAENA